MGVANLASANPLIGTWVHPEEFDSTVEYQISVGNNGLVVSAVDTYDREKGLVSEVESHGSSLSFTVTWPSTGRVCHCELKAASQSQVQFIFAYTESGYLVRKAT